MKENAMKKDHLSFKESVHNAKNSIDDFFTLVKEWIVDYSRIILPGILLAAICITLIIALNARNQVEAASVTAMEVLEETSTSVVEVEETEFEENEYPEINSLIGFYYEALQAADIDALSDLQSNMTDTEILRLQAMSPYIDHYDNLSIYTKPGPFLDTYIVYAYVDIYLVDCEVATPGLQAFYVCKDEEDFYYINNGELSEEESEYIKNISEQADVVNLKNTVNVNYNNLLEENEDIRNYWAKLSVDIDTSVGDKLAEEAMVQQIIDEQEALENPTEEEPEEEDMFVPTILKGKTNDLVNVRKSASSEADKIGMANKGDTYTVYEVMLNGWTSIDYEGKEGYIRSDFIDLIEPAEEMKFIGTVTTTTLLNVRSEASSSSAKLGVLSEGAIVELIEEVDGWCKINFDGEVGYISSEFVKK